ncbi:four-helix bundle copper-binding protein [Stutzerimonas stutzeri]|uniref:four-helix bundle copper-binding protein n=1 Tax=Stutzerimonas stutzeri TaxID=316 RepID=UPI001C2E1B32|nr:four-helix bundle copper-binding protein [Stutzerimonas stutzeri]
MLNAKYQSCIEACSNCAIGCETCAASCLREDDVKKMARCIELDRDCADLCALAAVLMARDSAQVQAICKLCAQACRECARECGQHQMDHCQVCAEACRQCAEACEKMAA